MTKPIQKPSSSLGLNQSHPPIQPLPQPILPPASSPATASATLNPPPPSTTSHINPISTSSTHTHHEDSFSELNSTTHLRTSTNNSNNQHGSRLTRFLSKFTTNNIHSKRKSSLPNLNHHHNAHSHLPSDSLPRPVAEDANRTIKPSSSKPGPLLALNTGNNKCPSSIDQSSRLPSLSSSARPDQLSLADEIGTDGEDGADPNASIRPLTPSSKAASTSSPVNALTSPASTGGPHSPADSRSFSGRRQSSGSLSSGSGEDGVSAFGNASLASTKPTTVVSLDGTGGMANRIAQPASLRSRAITTHHHHARSVASQPPTPTLTLFAPQHLARPIVNAPKHSLPHPSQNPHPALLSDNASMLTLASSGFSPSLHTTQNFPPDEDASVRALAPSRRESGESLSSRWSNVLLARTASVRTGGGTGFFMGTTVGSGAEEEGEEIGVGKGKERAAETGSEEAGSTGGTSRSIAQSVEKTVEVQ